MLRYGQIAHHGAIDVIELLDTERVRSGAGNLDVRDRASELAPVGKCLEARQVHREEGRADPLFEGKRDLIRLCRAEERVLLRSPCKNTTINRRKSDHEGNDE